MDLLGKFGIITGGSDGIGKAIAKTFVLNGANLWLVGRNLQKLKQVQQELSKSGTEIYISCADLSDYDQLTKVVKEISTKVDQIDFLVNNAGIAAFKPLEVSELSDYDLHFNLNVRAAILLSQGFLPKLKLAKGNIINISSYFSDRILPNTPSSIYSATKGAINSFTKALAVEVGPYVRVNAISPGTVETSLVKSNIGKMTPERKVSFENHIQTNYAMKKIGQPEYVAEMALFLASSKAEWITGGIFPVDGGLSAT